MSQSVNGSFPQYDSVSVAGVQDPYTLVDAGNATGFGLPAIWTTGVTRIQPINVQPSLMQKWNVLGFAVTARIGVSAVPLDVFNNPQNPYARFGKLFVGAMFDSTTANGGGLNRVGGVGSLTRLPGGAAFPPDLSTFTEVWDGSQDPARFVPTPDAVHYPDTSFTLIGETFMFPSPVEVRSGANIEMCMVLTPSLMSAGCYALVKSCTYNLLYDDTPLR